MDHAIATDRLTRRFGSVKALDDLTLQVPAGSIFGLIGPNGAGKTTALKVLMNVIRPSSGRAEVLGVDSRRLGPAQFARIGYVAESQRLPDWMTVRQLLDYCRPLYPTWDDALAARLLRLLDLDAVRPIRHLSRGMRMKAALVASLAYRPALLVLDEPFSGLDPLMRDEFVQGILELAGEGGWSAVISSHDLDEIERLIDHVGYLRRGSLGFSESIAALQARVRQIEVTPLDPSAPPVMPEPRPEDWLGGTVAGRTLQIVHARYVPGETERDLLARYPGAQIQATPMSLRETFIVLARRDRAEERPQLHDVPTPGWLRPWRRGPSRGGSPPDGSPPNGSPRNGAPPNGSPRNGLTTPEARQ